MQQLKQNPYLEGHAARQEDLLAGLRVVRRVVELLCLPDRLFRGSLWLLALPTHPNNHPTSYVTPLALTPSLPRACCAHLYASTRSFAWSSCASEASTLRGLTVVKKYLARPSYVLWSHCGLSMS